MPVTSSRGTALRALACAALLASPAALAAQQAPRAPEAQRSSTAQLRRDSAVRMARAQIGRRYLFGGTTPDGFDCSGFLRYLMRALGTELPRTAAEQSHVGREVPRDLALLRPGDLLFFGHGGRVTHVGLYVGNGRIIHASTSQHRIVEAELLRPGSALMRAWNGVRRLFDDSTTAVAQANPQR